MSLSKASSSCFILKRPCILTPEEAVRQRLLEMLCLEKGFPRGLCSVEVAIQSLKNVMLNSCEQRRSKRRIDILFSRAQESGLVQSALVPFFLIECKAFNSKRLDKNDFIDVAALQQVMGYRNKLGAIPYVAIASYDQIAIWSFLSSAKGLFEKNLNDSAGCDHRSIENRFSSIACYGGHHDPQYLNGLAQPDCSSSSRIVPKSSLDVPWYYGTVQNMPMWSELGS